MKITGLQITNYRGVRALTVKPGAAGAVVKGPNRQGKTSVLRAISAALAGEDIGPDAIRVGEDKAEILVNLDALSVRRSITRKGSTLSVTAADGLEYRKPQTMLNELLGGAGVDPLAFYLADEKERRRMVLEACRVSITAEQIQRWTGGNGEIAVDLRNGLLALQQLRQHFYDRRTGANKLAKEAKDAADRAAADLPAIPAAPALPVAERAVFDADRALEQLQIRAANAEGAHKALEASYARARELRAKADAALAARPPEPDAGTYDAALDLFSATAGLITNLREQLARAEADHQAAGATVRDLEKIMRARAAKEQEARDLMDSAESLSGGDPGFTLPPLVPAERIAEAQSALTMARADQAAAQVALRAQAAHDAAGIARLAAEEAAGKARALDRIVATLTEDAPKELAASPEMIPGIGFSEEGITLDGKVVDKLSGQEQLVVAVAIARRLNARSKILVCDGLERLDRKSMETFVRETTRDGWQLLCTRVSDDGEMVIEAIESGDSAAEDEAA